MAIDLSRQVSDRQTSPAAFQMQAVLNCVASGSYKGANLKGQTNVLQRAAALLVWSGFLGWSATSFQELQGHTAVKMGQNVKRE